MDTLYISDLDGTLLDGKAELSSTAAEMLNKAIDDYHLNFSVATARSPATVFHILSELHLTLPIIMMNGVLVYNMGEKRYDSIVTIPEGSFRNAIAAMKQNDVTGFVYTIENEELIAWYENLEFKAAYDFYEERRKKYDKHFEKVDDFSDFRKESIYISCLNTEEKLRPVYDAVKDDPELGLSFYRDVYSPNLWYLELYSHKASKKNALRFLKEQLQPKKTIAFGDNLNDLPLFEESDECYAVENALPQVKEKATGILQSNLNDGVARYLLTKCQISEKRTK